MFSFCECGSLMQRAKLEKRQSSEGGKGGLMNTLMVTFKCKRYDLARS